METSKEQWNSFEREWTASIVESVNAVRSTQGLTVNDLGARLRHLGWPVSDATLSGVLSGNKRSSISIAEVTILARALSTSPLYLILGLPGTEELPSHKIWNGTSAEPRSIYNVASWFFGIRNPHYPDDADRISETKETALVSRDTIYFIERTMQLSDLVWTDVGALIALTELMSLPADWRNKQDSELRTSLKRSITSLRRMRERRQKSSEKSELARIGVLSMPEAFAFVDSADPIDAAIDELNPQVLRSHISETRIASAKKYFLDRFDEESDVTLRLEDSP